MKKYEEASKEHARDVERLNHGKQIQAYGQGERKEKSVENVDPETVKTVEKLN